MSDYGEDPPVLHGVPVLEWSRGSWEVMVHEAQGGKFVHERGRGAAMKGRRTGALRKRRRESGW